MASPPETPGFLPTLTEELLEEIFLRLPTPAALARASTASPSFRRIITDRAFLRRFRALHPPPFLGVVDGDGFQSVERPHPSAPLARALAGAADFSFSFVPLPETRFHHNVDMFSGFFRYSEPDFWCPRDARDGRVLLECKGPPSYMLTRTTFPDLAVCDPLYRRYVLLPTIPEDLTSQAERLLSFVPLLAPASEGEDETSFKVICVAHFQTKLVVFVFSSVTREWCIAASPSCISLFKVECNQRCTVYLSRFNYVRGCFYWMTAFGDDALMLDTRTMELSVVKYSRPHCVLTGKESPDGCEPHVTVDREGALGICSIFDDEDTIIEEDSDGSSDERKLVNKIELPYGYDFAMEGAAEGFLFLRAIQLDGPEPMDYDESYFSLEVQTSEIKLLCRVYRRNYSQWTKHICSYFGFPPSLSKPSI